LSSYPFAHLSSNLEEPEKALDVLNYMRKAVPGDIELISAPFGWNKSLSLDIKGHPLAEQSKTYGLAKKKKVLHQAKQRKKRRKRRKKRSQKRLSRKRR